MSESRSLTVALAFAPSLGSEPTTISSTSSPGKVSGFHKLLSQAVGKRSAVRFDAHLEDEQGNSEDAVAESLDSAGVNLALHPLTLHLGRAWRQRVWFLRSP
jgi:hypothetical protein